MGHVSPIRLSWDTDIWRLFIWRWKLIWRESMLYQSEELVEYDKFQFQLDGIRKRMKDDLQGEHIIAINRDEDYVETNGQQLGEDEKLHDLVCLSGVDVLEKGARMVDV